APAAPTSTSAATKPPASDAEWKDRLHAALMDLGLAFTADGLEHSTVVATAAELQFTTPEEFMLGMRAEDLNQAVRKLIGRPMKIKITAGQSAAPAPRPSAQKAPVDETSVRAMDH